METSEAEKEGVVPLAELRRMNRVLDRYAKRLEPHADGSFQETWTDIDEARRSLQEAGMYLARWAYYRKMHGRDPVRPSPAKQEG